MKKIKEYIIITFGTLLTAFGVYFFKFPNNFSIGGVSGLSIILGSLFETVSPATFILIFNFSLLIIGFAVFGRSFGIKTAYSSILLSVSIYLLEKTTPLSHPLTNQPLLELVFSVMLPAIGAALLFNLGASTGGTDIAAMILRKKTSLDIGKALFLTDCIIVFIACIIFGIETGLFSILGLIAKALVVDNVIESIRLSKYFTIITKSPHEISEYINKTLHRGATMCNCKGVFSNGDRAMILTVLNRSQAANLKGYIKSVDLNAFVIISNTSDILGKGFHKEF